MQPKIINYHLYAAHVDQSGGGLTCPLTTSMQDFIGTGWQPFGAPFVFGDYICQAMVKFAGIEPTKADVERSDPLYRTMKEMHRRARA